MFKGIQKVSLVDYPPLIAATLFTGGCNFRCRWCHNWSLVDPDLWNKMPDVPEVYIKNFLTQRIGKIQGVCITGGEPTLMGEELALFMRWCKFMGFKVKLDTNGYLPSTLASYIRQGLIDFIAMDIKNSFDKYGDTVFIADIDIEVIKKSIELIKKSGIKHEFRTTMVTDIVVPDEIDDLELWLEEPITRQEFREVREKQTY